MTKTLYLFRHGQTDWNINKRFQGHSDIELNATGIKQAQKLSQYLENKKIDIIYSSDLSRAVETAKIVAKPKNIKVEATKILREAHLGKMEGLHINEAEQKFGKKFIQQWKSNEEKYLDIKFPDGESKRDMLSRVKNYLLNAIQHDSHQFIAISTHGGVIHKLVSNILGIEHLNYRVTNCCLFVFTFDQARFKLLEYKDFSEV